MHRHFYCTEDLDFPEFVSFCEQNVDHKDYSFSSGVNKKIVHYEGDAIRSVIGTPQAVELKTELHHCLKDGPGVFAIKQAFQNLKAVDRATEIFRKIIAEEKMRLKIMGIISQNLVKTNGFGIHCRKCVREMLRPSYHTMTTLFYAWFVKHGLVHSFK